MLKQILEKLKTLLRDDSGVAMAYTVLVSLFIFMLCFSSYAMAANIRQRMELQQSCDAAAYSGAVVQADMLSRLAVLNRALSWTYIETNKRHMDYTVDEWLQRIIPAYERIETSAKLLNASGNCGVGTNGAHCLCPIGQKGICWFAGAEDSPRHVKLNGSRLVSVDLIRSAMGRAYPAEAENILNGYSNITVINSAINNIRNSINSFVGTAVDAAMKQMIGKDAAKITFACHTDGKWGNSTPASYIIPQKSEERFVNYANTTVGRELDRGRDVWWNLLATGSAWWFNGGFARNCSNPGALVATGEAKARRHIHTYSTFGSSHFCGITRSWGFTENGRELLSSSPARPAALAAGFFGAPGTILVAAKRQVENPFSVWMGSALPGTLFGTFNGGGRDMWVLSTARAGIRLGGGYGTADEEGFYRILCPGEKSGKDKYRAGEGTWNLCEEDWDAVMIPVNRAWHDASQGEWLGTPSAESILASVKEYLAPETRYRGGIGEYMRH